MGLDVAGFHTLTDNLQIPPSVLMKHLFSSRNIRRRFAMDN